MLFCGGMVDGRGKAPRPVEGLAPFVYQELVNWPTGDRSGPVGDQTVLVERELGLGFRAVCLTVADMD
jgi:hypothetical protein